MSAEDNFTLQAEEIEVMKSIYGDEWIIEDNHSFHIQISERNVCVDFYVTLPENYPLHSPPIYTLVAPSLRKLDKQKITNDLSQVYLENIGQTVLYQWVEKLRECLQRLESFVETELSSQETASNLECNNLYVNDVQEEAKIIYDIEIVHGELIVDRKSSFQGHLAVVTTLDEVKWVIEKLYENKKIQNATHNIRAYRLLNSKDCYIQDCDDDGESEAGGRLLHLLHIVEASNVLVVVSRWYGGIKLGSDRFRHINNAARQVLEQANMIKQKKKSKK